MTEEKKDPESGAENAAKSVAATAAGKPARGGRRTRVIAAVVAAVVVLGGVGGYACAVQSAYSSYESQVEAAGKADARLAGRLAGAEKLLRATKSTDVLDKGVLDGLSGSVKAGEALKGVPEQRVNRWLLWDVSKAKANVVDDAAEADAAVARIDKAMDRVEASRTAKQVKAAGDGLSKTVESAEKAYKDSDGKVADNKTREALKTAIDKAKKTKADGKAGAKALKDMDATLAKAVRTVQDSVTAKAKADAAKTAQAQASNATGSAGSSYANGGYSNGSYAGSSYSNSTGSASGSYSGNGGSYSQSTQQRNGSANGSGSSAGDWDWKNAKDDKGGGFAPITSDNINSDGSGTIHMDSNGNMW